VDAMRARLIIGFFVLIAVLIFANWLAGRILASQVDHQLRQFAETDDRIDYDHKKISVNPAFGSLTIEKLIYESESDHIRADKITGSLTYADMWRIIRKRSENPMENVRSFRLNAQSVSVTLTADARGSETPDGEPVSVSFRSLTGIYNGRLDELSGIAADNRPPGFNHRLNISADDISVTGFPEITGADLPILAGYKIPENISHISLQIRYRAQEKSASLSAFRIESPELVFRANGLVTFGETGWPDEPESWSLDYDLSASTHELARLPISPRLGGFSMDTMSVSSSVTFDKSDAGRHPLTLPGKNRLHLGNISWYPPDHITEQYGMMFNMFGIPESRLPVRALDATWELGEDTLRIEEATFYTEPFDALLSTIVALPADRDPDIVEGSIRFVRTSADFNDFIDGFEGLFQIDLPRKDGRIHLDFSGDPASPELNVDLP